MLRTHVYLFQSIVPEWHSTKSQGVFFTIDRLPQEIINQIVMFLDQYPDREGVPNVLQQGVVVKSSALPPFATISSQWKEAVEFITFHRLDIKSEDLGELRTIVTLNR